MIAIAAVVAAIVLVGAAIFATVQFGREPDDRRGAPPPPIDPEPTLPADPPLKAAALERVLLSIGRLNEIVGSTAMTITSDLTTMTDHSADVSDRECLGAMYGAETPVYAKSGWTAVRDQVAREPGENDHWVEQTAVLYPSAEHAAEFLQRVAGAIGKLWGTHELGTRRDLDLPMANRGHQGDGRLDRAADRAARR